MGAPPVWMCCHAEFCKGNLSIFSGFKVHLLIFLAFFSNKIRILGVFLNILPTFLSAETKREAVFECFLLGFLGVFGGLDSFRWVVFFGHHNEP